MAWIEVPDAMGGTSWVWVEDPEPTNPQTTAPTIPLPAGTLPQWPNNYDLPTGYTSWEQYYKDVDPQTPKPPVIENPWKDFKFPTFEMPSFEMPTFTMPQMPAYPTTPVQQKTSTLAVNKKNQIRKLTLLSSQNKNVPEAKLLGGTMTDQTQTGKKRLLG